MISEELLKEVLNIERVTEIHRVSMAVFYQEWSSMKDSFSREDISGFDYKRINVYSLAHECKKWAYEKGYWIDSNLSFVSIDKSGSSNVVCTFNGYDLKLDEPDLIFEACEWILKKVNNQ